MKRLISEIERLIKALEMLRDSLSEPSWDITEKIDLLRTIQLNLISEEISKKTKRYKTVTAALNEASKKTKDATHGLSKPDLAIQKVSNAISAINQLRLRDS
ncbi:hypothetical protein ACJJIU_08180 [Microbulbifer sp. CnH-101-E]|uniref:hypothetical protein n=1 Tax=unclassified Microbulbifer TaxID=2619833 RepID=UPI00403933F8